MLAVAAIALWALLATASQRGWLEKLDFAAYDFLIRAHPKEVSQDVVVVAIDRASVCALGPQRLWRRGTYAKLVTALGEAEALAVAFDILFTSSLDEAGDTQFLEAMADDYAPTTILASAILSGQLCTPYEPFTQIALYQGIVNIEPGPSGRVRSIPISARTLTAEGDAVDFYGFGFYAAAAYESILAELDTLDIRMENHHVPDGELYPAFPAQIGQVPQVSFIDVLNGKFEKDLFRDKLVFVGSTVNPNDRFRVPISRCGTLELAKGVCVQTNEQLMPGVELHAVTASSLINDTFIRVIDRHSLGRFLLAGIALVVMFAVARIVPLKARLAALCLIIVGTGATSGVLWSHRLFVPLTVLPLSALASGGLAVLYEIHIARLRTQGLKNIFGRYVSGDVLKKILSDPSRLSWSEDRTVSVLFCDIRSFTPLAERLEPAQTLELLNTYFEAATRAVLNAGGSVDKFVGDEIMAVFNAPLDMANHASAAIRAGLDILKELETVNEALQARGLPEIAVGIGIHTGPVVAGNIGSSVRTEYGIIGDTVNTAARLVGKAAPGQILASEKTVSQAGKAIQTQPSTRMQLKGKRETVQAFIVLEDRDSAEG